MPSVDAQLSLCIAATQSTVSGDTALLQQVAFLHKYDLFSELHVESTSA